MKNASRFMGYPPDALEMAFKKASKCNFPSCVDIVFLFEEYIRIKFNRVFSFIER
jgi:hypothetical protein